MSLNPGSGSSVDLDFASVCWMHDEILGTRMSEADVIDRLSTLSDRGEELGDVGHAARVRNIKAAAVLDGEAAPMGPHLSLPTMGGCETDAVLLVVATRTATAVSRIACLRSATTLRLSGEFPTAAWPAQATA